MKGSQMTKHILDQLFLVIEERKDADPSSSYVASLHAKGTEKIAEKIGEESTETIIKAIKGDKENLAQESADLLFHLMILWSDAGLKPQDIFDVLEKRQGTSGIEEKASRKQ